MGNMYSNMTSEERTQADEEVRAENLTKIMGKRVNCENCFHFSPEVWNDTRHIRVQKDSCKLGNRIMFRMPTPKNEYFSDEYGYVRRCNDFRNR